MNIISWNRAYALFPNSTFKKHQNFSLSHIHGVHNAHSDRIATRYRQYEDRGWKMLETKHWQIHNGVEDCVLERMIGDVKTVWKIELDISRITASMTPDFVLEFCSFSLKLDRNCFGIELSEVQSLVLKHRYTAGAKPPIGFWRYAEENLQTATEVEMHRLGIQNWLLLRGMCGLYGPPDLSHEGAYQMRQEVISGVLEAAILPPTWHCYDDMMPTLLIRWGWKSHLGDRSMAPELPVQERPLLHNWFPPLFGY